MFWITKKVKIWKIYCAICGKHRKHYTFSKKTLVFSIICSVGIKTTKYLEKKNQLNYYKFSV